jgi:F-type H+-transporting ATPase subunit gamma
MANLKAIRRRIKSVQATQKITRAMRLVAAAKVRRAQMRVIAARPFTAAVMRILQDAVRDLSKVDLEGLPLLHHRPVKKVALIVLSSDRGLCGSYNSNILREAMARIQALRQEGKEVSLISVGLKAAAYFRTVKIDKLKSYTLLPAIPTVEEAKLIAEHACELFVSGKVDSIELIGTEFISLLRSRLRTVTYLPVEIPQKEADDAPPSPIKLFEPSIWEVMEKQLLPKYVENVIFQALVEAAAAELAARMNAMTNASNNARDLISALTLSYNKARQAGITQDLLEIVGGAEALRA